MEQKPMKSEMTPEEEAEMEKMMAVAPAGYREEFRMMFRCGFALGRLSSLTHIINNQPLYNGELKQQQLAGDKVSSASDSKERVEAPGKERNTRAVHRKRKD